MNEAFCLECEQQLKVGTHPHKGQQVTCPECETRHLIVRVDPLELELALPANPVADQKIRSRTVKMACPECDDLIMLNVHAHLGQGVICSGCEAALEVIGIRPLELDVAMPVAVKRDQWPQERRQKQSKGRSGPDRSKEWKNFKRYKER